MAVILTLGPILFADWEIPEKINFGGEQELKVHKLPGGAKVINPMGVDHRQSRWAGRLRGSDALFRARFLDFLRIEAKPRRLQYDGFDYTVLIRSFDADYRQHFEIEYTIVCEVVADNLNPILDALFTLDEAISTSLNNALQVAAQLGLPGIQTAIAGVETATSIVQTFQGQTAGALGAVTSAIGGAQTAVAAASSAANSVVAASGSVAGIVAGGSPASMASGLVAQAQSFTNLAGLGNIQASLDTMAKNIGSAVA